MGIAASGPVLDMRTPFGRQDAQTRSAASTVTEPVEEETRGQAVHRVSSVLVIMLQCKPGRAGAAEV